MKIDKLDDVYFNERLRAGTLTDAELAARRRDLEQIVRIAEERLEEIFAAVEEKLGPEEAAKWRAEHASEEALANDEMQRIKKRAALMSEEPKKSM